MALAADWICKVVFNNTEERVISAAGALSAGRAGLRGIVSWLLERALIYSLKLSIFSDSDRQGNGKQLRLQANCLNVSTLAILPFAVCGSALHVLRLYCYHCRTDSVTLQWCKFDWRDPEETDTFICCIHIHILSSRGMM